ncbi:hypothetical protein [Nonomuraea basaltis]|uniref:hypothetical protein n=1 Tax=Nonomuraea basaltis TaxID=2495887 RepID=UPI00110C710F|nr:hypothetical protein [Nonomuraea basaltis]TMS00328.1 hypothetical protein EJK15_02830 [Nonomuraea basaltis]
MSRLMPRPAVVVAAILSLLLVAAVIWWLAARPSGAPPARTSTIQAGAVEVSVTPLVLDRSGARFKITLDTHTVPLDLDLPRAAILRIDARAMSQAIWNETAGGSHHREGTLAFADPVPPGAAVELRITGLPKDVTSVWTAP